jgi:hypothetical protein
VAYERHGRQRSLRAAIAPGRRQAELPAGLGDAEVRCRERVGVAECAHRHGRDGPRADARQPPQHVQRLHAVGPGGERSRSPRSRAAATEQRGGPPARHGQRGRIQGRERGGGREGPPEGAALVDERGRQRVAQGGHEAAGDRPGGPGRDLLAEHDAQRELAPVDAARHAPAGGGLHGGAQERIVGERGVDGHRVGVQVEQPAAARDRR